MFIPRSLTSLMFLALAALLLVVPLPVATSAQGNGPTDDEVNEIADDLYCPVCENIPLDTCGTQACIQWRDLIREKLAAGWTEQEIKAYFVEQYGDRVLATPPPRGLNWLVYVVPPLALLLGAGVLFRVVQSWRREPQGSPQADPGSRQSHEPYVSRLEEELRRRESDGS